jgi:hypothetical protein
MAHARKADPQFSTEDLASPTQALRVMQSAGSSCIINVDRRNRSFVYTYSCVLETIESLTDGFAALSDDRVTFCIGGETRLLGFLGWLQQRA